MHKPIQIVVFFAFIALFHPLPAAAPVVHAHCAELYFRYCRPDYSQQQRDAFLRGTLFPDIRYIAKIPRSRTHEKQVSLSKIMKTKNPFTAGLLFHSYVDKQREAIAQQQKIYEHLTDVPQKQKGRFLKTVEDELCYHALNSHRVRQALLRYDSEEAGYGVSFIKRMAWHRILRNYLRQSPLQLFERKASVKSGYFSMSPEMVRKASVLIKKYKADKKVTDYFAHFLTTFENLLQKK